MNRWITRGALLLLVVWAILGLDLQSLRLDAISRGLELFVDRAFPLNLGILPEVWPALLETIQIAILATAIGFAGSIPVALLATRTLTNPWLAAAGRAIASTVRVMPSILWAILAVLILGFGPLAGVVAMAFYTIGYLSKLQYEAFEGLPRDPQEALRAMGASKMQIARHAILPEASNILRSQLLWMFEYNIRSSTVIGVVGAGGVGRLLSTYLKFFQYDRVLALLLFLLVVVLILDAISYAVRRRYLELDVGHERPRWRDIFFGA